MWQYIKYLWQAKGRHGTHSPFIYQFVEEALHEPQNFNYPKSMMGGGTADKLTLQLFRVINHFSLSNVVEASAGAFEFCEKMPFEWQLIDADQIETTRNANVLVVLASDLSYLAALQEARPFMYDTVLVLHPNNSFPLEMVHWHKEKPNQYNVFAWHFSILLMNPNFKRSQFFVLR